MPSWVKKLQERSSVQTRDDLQFTVKYRVWSSLRNHGPFGINTLFGIQTGIGIGSAYSFGTDTALQTTRCSKISIDLIEDLGTYHATTNPNGGTLWDVTVEYTTKGSEEQQNPLDKPPEVSFEFDNFTRAVTQTWDGTPILNSAAKEFNPPIEIDDSRPVLRIRRNEASFNPSIAIQYQNAVNSDSFYGVDPRVAKILKIGGNYRKEVLYTYWEVEYVISFNRDTWDLRPLSRGFYSLAPGGGWERAKDESGKDTEEPVLLSQAGLVTTTPYWHQFQVYQPLPFAPLNLPQVF